MYYVQAENRYITAGEPFTLGFGESAIQYPPNWLDCASAAELSAAGIYAVQDVGAPANDLFYVVTTELQGAKRVYINTPRNVQQVRTVLLEQIRQRIASLLSPTDYKFTRLAETGKTVDQATLDYRAAVRAAYAANESLINAATTTDQLAAIQFTWPVQGA